MPYPPPPWELLGHGVQCLHLLPTAAVRPLIPPELEILSVWPGKTIGVIAFAHYGPGSTIAYNELIVAPAAVRGPAGWGVWISHIYVDDPDSMAGGREIWGVPKQLAEFTWHEQGAHVEQAGQTLASLHLGRCWWLTRTSVRFPTYSRLNEELICFVGRASGRVGWDRGAVDVPSSSPFSILPWGRPKAILRFDDLRLECGAPSPLGMRLQTEIGAPAK